MRVTLSISAYGPNAAAANELKKKLEALMAEYGLTGEIKGQGYEQFASYFANYNS